MMKMLTARKSFGRTVRNSTEALLWVVFGICITTYALAQLSAVFAQERAIESFRDRVTEVDRSLWSESRIAHHETALAQVEDDVPLGILSVPSIDLEVAIFDGTSTRALNLGIGRVAGTARVGEPDNLALAGHRDGFFRGLKNIDVGDELILETDDRTQHYEVTEYFVVTPEDVYVLEQNGEPSITLITCYPFYVLGHAPKRFIVRARLQN